MTCACFSGIASNMSLGEFEDGPYPSRMNDDKSRKPETGFLGYVIIVVGAVLVAWFVLRPLGQQVHDVFQTLANSFTHH
jgi:hypothetical protein